MYGTQACSSDICHPSMFENDVKMYGTQAHAKSCKAYLVFENDVKMYGTQAVQCVVYG